MGKLLEKALKSEVRRRMINPTEDEIELAIAYVYGGITGAQLSDAIDAKSPGGAQSFTTSVLRGAVHHNKITINRKL